MNPEPHPLNPVLEALDDGFCRLDPSWRVTYWNASAERVLALPRAEALGRVLWELFPQLEGSATQQGVRAAQEGRAPERFLDWNPRGRGHGYLSVHAAPLPDGGIAVQFRDATGEVRHLEQYSMLLESIRHGFVAVDPRWRIVYLNRMAESILRFPRQQAMGVSLWSALAQESAEIREQLMATMRDGVQRHLREVQPGGRLFGGRLFDVWIYPLVSGGVSILFEDVSERVQHERELARLAEEAREANRAKSRFFAAVSHELRTPLNAIIGYNHLLSTGTYGPMTDGACRAAERAGLCAEHLGRLVDDVLLLTTAEIGRLPVVATSLDLQEFVPGMVRLHRHQAEAKGLAFLLELAPDLPTLESDPQRLRQLLGALVSNAVKFTRAGEVRLRVRHLPGTDRGEIEFEVSDTGPGIAPEERERIFGAFEQLGDPARSESMARGAGLGLTIARQLSTLLRGSLHLAETSPTGSRFRVLLPVDYDARSR